MAQNLSFIETELQRVAKQAANAERQMRLLEKAMADVIIQGSKGSGASSLLTGGAGVQNVAQRALRSPYMNPSGSPVGGRAIVGSDVDTDKIKGIAKEYDRLKSQLNRYHAQLDLLTKAEQQQVIASERLAAAKTEAAVLIDLQAQADLRVQAQAKQSATAKNKEYKTLGDKVRAYEAEIAAVKKTTAKQEEVATTLGALAGQVPTYTDTVDKTKGKGKGAVPQRVYTQQDLANIYSKTPQAASQVSQIAQQSGFKPQDIKSVTAYANSYTQLQYAVRDANGVMRKLVLTTDKAGNVFTSTQKQFRTFFGSIRRNVTEMIKWSAATLVVWGAIRKLGELLEIAIKNETALASIAVILGEEHVNLTNVFNSAAEAAAATGEAIDGVLEGYVQAYRATGNIADQTERARQAQVLLIDALTLSKLSSMTTAQAMDTLTGALRQAGLGFEDGYILLDKWVAVSRQANVSIETLAESFAITATSASNAGLTWDELNGVIATLAESTTLSATESGNAIRAFIGGFSTDLAIKELGKFGIAVVDSTGETRGFLDVMKEISAMFEQGIISEGELNKIARAIGGRGARRGAQVATTIKNLGRAQEVAEVSARAHGDAQKALNIQLDTVQTAITKLSNSFQKLARAMGAEGGVLGVAGSVLDIFTKMVDATASLVKNLGDMTPILAGMAVIFAATSKETRGLFATNLVSGVGGFINRATGGPQAMDIQNQRLQAGMAGGFVAGGQTQQGLGTSFTNRLLGPGYGRNAGSLIGQGLAGGFTAYSAIKDLKQGNQAGAAGSVVGGILGGLISGGSPVGIVIGTAAGEAFANATFGYKAEFSRFFATIFDEAEEAAGEGGATGMETATEGVFAELGLGSAGFGKALASISAKALNLGYQGGAMIGNITGGLRIGDYEYQKDIPQARITAEQFALSKTLSGAGQDVFDVQAKQEALKGFEAGGKPGAFQFAVTDEQEKLLIEYEEFLADLEATQAEIFRAGAVSGDISAKELGDALDQIPKLQAILTKYEVTFGDEIRKVNDEVGSVTDSFEYWTNIVVNGSAEQTQHLTAVSDEIAGIYNAIEQAAREGTPDQVQLAFDIEETKDIDEAEIVDYETALGRAAEKQQNLVAEAQAMTRAINAERIVLPTMVDLDISAEDVPILLAKMEEMQDTMFEGWWSEGLLTDFSEGDIEATLAPFMLALGQDSGMKYIEGFQQSIAGAAFEELVAAGEITPTKPDERRGLQSFDIASGQLPAVMARYQELVGITGQAGYIPDEETFAALFTDYIAMPITADLTLLNIAMQELIDVNKKELDGIYNLPTDASFYVPFTGYQLGFVNQGGGGGTGLEGLGAGNVPEDERVRPGRPEGYRPRSRGRFRIPVGGQIDHMIEEEVEEVVYAGGQPARAASALRGKGRPVDQGSDAAIQLPSITDMLLNFMGISPQAIETGKAYFGAQGTPQAHELLPGADAAGSIITDLGNLLKSLFGLEGEDSVITTKLQIESTTNTIVQLDGQVIANAIKPYLLNDEIRYEGTAGSAVKRFVI